MRIEVKSLLAGILTVIILFGAVVAVHANNSQHNPEETDCNSNNLTNCPNPTPICGDGEHTGNPHCNPSPTETIAPTATPTNSPSATPTPTKKPKCSPTPTQTPISPTSEPSATPTVTPAPTDVPQNNTSNNSNSGGNDNHPLSNNASPYDGQPVGWK